jgi:hypothetical protein
MVAGAEVVRGLRAQQPVGEEPRHVHAGRVDGGEPVEQRSAEVEIDVVRAAGELAYLRAVLGVGLLARRALPPAGGLALALLAGALLSAGSQVLDGARHGGLDELAVHRAVEDHLRAVELEQYAGGARLIKLGLADPDRRRPVGVAVELAVQRLGLAVERAGLLAQLQLGDLILVQRAAGQRGEQLAGPVREHLADQPARVARQLRAQLVALRRGLGDHLGDQRGQLRGDRLDLQQRVDPGDRDVAAADERLRGLAQLEDPAARGDAAPVPAQHGRGAVDGVAVGEHLLDRARFLQRRQRRAQHVFGALVAARALGVVGDHRGDRRPAQLARGGEAVLAGDQCEPVAVERADRDGDDQAAHGHRAGQRGDVFGVELAHVAADVDLVKRDVLRATGGGGSGHGGPP